MAGENEEKVFPDRPKLILPTTNDWDDTEVQFSLSTSSPDAQTTPASSGAPRRSTSNHQQTKSQHATPTRRVKRNRSRTWQLPASSINAYAAWVESKPTKYRSLAEVHFLEKYRLKKVAATSSFVEDTTFSVKDIARSSEHYSNTALSGHTKEANDILGKVEYSQHGGGKALDPDITMFLSGHSDSARVETAEGYLPSVNPGFHSTPDNSSASKGYILSRKKASIDSLHERMDQLGISQRSKDSPAGEEGDWPMSQP